MAPALADFGKGGGLCSLCWWCLWLGWPPHQAFMAICNVGSHHEDDGVGRDLLMPHTLGDPST